MRILTLDSMNSIIDTHCHLADPKLYGDLDGVLQRAADAGIDAIVSVGAISSIETDRRTVEIAERHPHIYAAIGVHPHDAKECDADRISALRELAQSKRVVAIGESGLDFHYMHSPAEVQEAALRRHLELASELELPISIHCRNAEERLLDLLMPAQPEATDSADRTREKLREKLRAGKLDERMVEIDVKERGPTLEVSTAAGVEEMDVNLRELLPNLFGQRSRKRKMRVAEALDYTVQEEEQKLIDMDQVVRIALERVESSGIIFLDEIDKIAGREGGHGPDVSREGVQRDILPIVEGTTVNTRHGFVKTDHILFIAAGAFHVSKPSDMIPELQGRFPIRVELKSLTVEDFIRILTEPKSSLVKQSTALLETEGLKLEFTPEALAEMAQFAFRVNETTENIGARRLHTIMERVLDEISFQAPDLFKSPRSEATEEGVVAKVVASGTETPAPPLPVIERKREDGTVEKVIVVDPEYVKQQVASIVKDHDLSRYIL